MSTVILGPGQMSSGEFHLADPDRAVEIERRQQRINEFLTEQKLDAVLLTSPVSLRYAVDFREYQLFQSRIPTYAVLVPAEGDVIVFGASNDVPLADQHRPGLMLNTFERGMRATDSSLQGLAEVTNEFVSTKGRLAIERLHTADIASLVGKVDLIDAEPLMEAARSIKSGPA